MYNLNEIKKTNALKTTDIIEKDDVYMIKYKSYKNIDWINNAFSTRLGGVSGGFYSEMNLSFTVGDNPLLVKENFQIFGKAAGINPNQMVYSHQTHTTNVMKVEKRHMGMGIISDRDFADIDGLVTNVSGICLVTSYADCVPLYFVDVKNKAIGLSHSGWKGTVGNICKNTVELMTKEYGSNPEDIVACIGPSICKNCYEVSEDVAEKFKAAFNEEQIKDILSASDKEDKFQLDLHKANYYNMINCGIREENISMPDICTCCNPTFLHSHRASGGKRGGLCAFLAIK